MKRIGHPHAEAKHFNALHISCQNIATLAALLETCGTSNAGDVVQANIVADAGQMLTEEAAAMSVHIHRLSEARTRNSSE